MRQAILAVIAAVLLAGPSQAQTFNDVPPEYWAHDFIEALAASGITAGCGNGNYCPNSPVTRAQMAVFLLRGIYGAGFRPAAALGNVFGDVPANAFAASFIERLYADRITLGCGSGNYCPTSTVTRAQMAVFLLRAKHGANYRPPAAMGVFADVAPGAFAADFIEQLAKEGITGGCGNGNYCPNSPVTRAQMAVFLVRAFGLPLPPTVTFTSTVTSVRKGQGVTLSWNVSGAVTCSASGGWSGGRPLSGSEHIQAIEFVTSFTLGCQGAGGASAKTVTVYINAVAGQILLSSISRSDSDVNDPEAPYSDNGSALTAQSLPNPVVVGGYVNEANRGPEGRSFADGDLDDLYRVSLIEGQIIELVMPSADPSLPDSERDDADLVLFDLSGELIDASVGVGQIEQLTVPATGEYYVLVTAWSGAPLYRLSIGQSSVTAASDSLRLSDDFVTGEAIVVINGDDATSGLQEITTTLKNRYGWTQKAGAPSREMLVEMPGWTQAMIRRERPMLAAQNAEGFRIPSALQPKWETLQYVKMLRVESAVRSASPNRILRTMAVPNDPLYAAQRWHYEMIQLPAAWDVAASNPNVIVAIVDTGVVAHPDLLPNLVEGYDFVSNPFNQDGDGIDPVADDPGCVLVGSSNYHGTHVAGTVAASTNNASGVAGVAGGARIMRVRALDNCGAGGSFYDIMQAIRYAAGLSNNSGTFPLQHADVINMSLGGAGACDSMLVDLFAAVRAQGVIPIAAAGNENSSVPRIPASCPGVVSVSSLAPDRSRAYYSNFGGSWVDVAAPGGDVRFDRNGDGVSDGVFSTWVAGAGSDRFATYKEQQGTSMAAPHVAGVAALMKGVNSALTPGQFDQLLAGGTLTDDIGPTGPDDLGVGLVNALKAVQAASGSTPAAPAGLAITPSTLNFGDVGSLAEVFATNSGTGTLTLTNLTTSAAWIQAGAAGVDGNGLGRYQIRVERAGLPAGIYSGWVEFTSTAGTKRVSVLMQVSISAGEPDAGRQYVLLIDAGLLEAAEQVEVQASGESVQYRFDFVDTGEYYVVSGTDLNNDGFICDDGEACGIYPVENDPLLISIEGERTGVDFASTYRTGVRAESASAGGRSVGSLGYGRRR